MRADGADTIFALSSGPPPAAIAIVRLSGTKAGEVLTTLAGDRPPARRATLRTLSANGDVIDRALVLWFPAPNSSTGEDSAEFHLHGGRAVVAALETAFAAMPGLRRAEAGEFTRRALLNGRIDLTEAEGLADLLTAETESQRRAALGLSGGRLSRDVAAWRDRLLTIAARVEAQLDFAEEGDLVASTDTVADDLAALRDELSARVAQPSVERLRDGIRVVLAGPPNVGKSSLLNALVGRDAAIIASTAGTTRDVIEVPVAIDGMPFLFVDTAGLRDADDAVERIGVERARDALDSADIVLWLGDETPAAIDRRYLLIHPRADLPDRAAAPSGRLSLSVRDDRSVDALKQRLGAMGTTLVPQSDDVALNRRHRDLLAEISTALTKALAAYDPVLRAEEIRHALASFDRVTGAAGVEDMLDRLFSGLCIGK